MCSTDSTVLLPSVLSLVANGYGTSVKLLPLLLPLLSSVLSLVRVVASTVSLSSLVALLAVPALVPEM